MNLIIENCLIGIAALPPGDFSAFKNACTKACVSVYIYYQIL